jgi:DNA-binding transcriptional regulator YbjK
MWRTSLQALMEQMERRDQQLNEQLLNRQEQFHREVTVAYTGLARSVGSR